MPYHESASPTSIFFLQKMAIQDERFCGGLARTSPPANHKGCPILTLFARVGDENPDHKHGIHL